MHIMAKHIESFIITEIQSKLQKLKKPDLDDGDKKKEVVIVKFIDSKNKVDETASTLYMKKKLGKAEELLGDYITTSVMTVDIDEYRIYPKYVGEVSEMFTAMLLSLKRTLTGKYIIVQKPLPAKLDSYMRNLDSKKDVTDYLTNSNFDIDCICDDNIARMFMDDKIHLSNFLPCTVAAVRDIMKYGLPGGPIDNGRGKVALIIGRSIIVGKPLSLVLSSMGYTTILAHSGTHPSDLKEFVNKAHVVVSAVGKLDLISEGDISKENLLGKVLIDVGINKGHDGKICGDISKRYTEDHDTHFITPVPGGVGPLTVLNFVKNIVTLITTNK